MPETTICGEFVRLMYNQSMKTNEIRIIVADDHKLFRKGLISILSDLPQVSVIAEAENGEQLLNILKTTPTDIVLLDLRMPLMDGYEVLAIVKSKFPTVKAIVISMFDAESHIVNAIEAGAKGFLTKDSDPEEIAIAIENPHFVETAHTKLLILEKLLQILSHGNKSRLIKASMGAVAVHLIAK